MYAFPLRCAPGAHEQALRAHFGASFEETPQQLQALAGREVVMVAFTTRSGANLLCDLLASDPRFSKGREIFDHAFVTRTCNELRIPTFADYLRGMVLDSASRQQTLCAKVSWNQLYMLTRLGVLSPPALNPKFLHITREDKIDQAISLFLAERSQQWIARKDEEIRPAVTLGTLTDGDFTTIIEKLDWIWRSEARLDLYFAQLSVAPFRITYEELICAPYAATLKRLQDYLGVAPSKQALDARFEPSIRKQATDLNLEIKRQLLKRYELRNIQPLRVKTPMPAAGGAGPRGAPQACLVRA